MKKYDVLLFDVDGTLLDFDRAEEMGIEGLLEHYGVPVTAENKEKYHHLNKSYWERLERGEITRDQGLSLRSSSGTLGSPWTEWTRTGCTGNT